MASKDLMTLYSFDTDYSACSVESCYSSKWGSILATGTYQVNKVLSKNVVNGGECSDREDVFEESPATERLGRIYLHLLRNDELGDGISCEKVFSLECAAVLDMKWSSEHPEPRLAVADSRGNLTVYTIAIDESCQLLQWGSIVISQGLALALEWNSINDSIIVSDSKGCVSVVHLGECLHVNTVFDSHSYEAWTCCFSKRDQNLMFSGGDDCMLSFYDKRIDSNKAIKKNTKSHMMGVTSMVCSSEAEDEWLMWTGSYDESVRLWDIRNARCEVDSISVGGGVWRIKQKSNRLLIGAMHDGFKIVEGTEVVEEYREHKSLAYGADWIQGLSLLKNDAAYDVIATCSFYDKMLNVWCVKK